MAETDILNPPDWQSLGFDFNPNPSYGFTRRQSENRQSARPRMGDWPVRDSANGGHVFPLVWNSTSPSVADRVVKFAEDFKAGYFTYIDQDVRGRHFVGRFSTKPDRIEIANGKYTLQGGIFEEIPRARMLQYPADFDYDGHYIYTVDDNGNPRVAAMQGTWAAQVSPAAPPGSSPTDPSTFEFYNGAAAPGDWAQIGYTGWGFLANFRGAAGLGLCDIMLDNLLLVGGLDLSAGTAASVNPLVTLTPNYLSPAASGVPASVFVCCTGVPLDMHRLKIVVSAASPAGRGMIFPAISYLY